MSDLWLLAGQSNMEGCGLLDDLESPHPDVRSFIHGDKWQTAEEPLHWMIEATDPFHWGATPEADLERVRKEYRTTRTKGAGCGLTFAKTLVAATGTRVDLLPVAHGGTSMQQWSPDLKDRGGRSLFGAMLRRTRLALETSGDTRLAGVLWYQGESDCNPNDAALYTQRMERMISEWRKDLDSPNLPFFVVQLGCFAVNNQANPDNAESWNLIREAQRLLPTRIPNLFTIPAIDLALDDGIHIGTHSLKRLGKRLANAVLSEVYGQNAPKPIELRSVTNESGVLRVSYTNVTGRLVSPDPAGRIPGFQLLADGTAPERRFHKTIVDPKNPADVLLHGEAPITPTSTLVYGYGFDPFCQLADEADMAVPAFGPVEIG